MEKTTEFEHLEQEMGLVLREMKTVHPDSGFIVSLRQRLATAEMEPELTPQPQHTHLPERQRDAISPRYSKLLRVVAATAATAAVIVGSLVYHPKAPAVLVTPQSPPHFGGMVLAAERSNAPTIPGVFPLRQAPAMDYVWKGQMPTLPERIPIYQLKPTVIKDDEFAAIAGRLGIMSRVQSLPVGDGSGRPDLLATDGQSALRLDGNTGALSYEGVTVLTTTGEISDEEAKQAALVWLRQTGLLPAGDLRVTAKNPYSEQTNEGSPFVLKLVTVQPAWLTTDDEGLGYTPRWRVTINTQGRVIAANGQWAEKQGDIDLPLRSYQDALNALEAGEGLVRLAGILRDGYQPIARVSSISWSHAQAKTPDGNTYLVPVAVVRGQAEQSGGIVSAFSGYVSLFAPDGKNLANYVLRGTLPSAPELTSPLAPFILSPNDISELVRRLGVSGVLVPSTGANPETYLYLGNTADGWRLQVFTNGSWVFDRIGAKAPDLSKISPAEAVVAARQYVRGLDFTVDEPTYQGAGLVSFPLLYNGAPVFSEREAQVVSALIVAVGENNEIQSVRCDEQMKNVPGSLSVITPEEAWQMLISNIGTVRIEGFGVIDGTLFDAAEAVVEDARLVYLQRMSQQTGVFDYLPAYQFKGQALVGQGKMVKFSTIVAADKNQLLTIRQP